MGDVVLRAEGLSKEFQIGERQQRYRTVRDVIAAGLKARPWARAARLRNTIWALKDVSFEIRRGEIIGVVGRNGAGKSTLLKVLSRITEPTAGFVDVTGRVGALLEVGTGFHPELTGCENIFLNAAILGMSRDEVSRQLDAIIAFAEVEQFIDTPVKHYSSGMYLRLAFAVAAHLQPDILLIDEVLAVGDAKFQAKCLGKMNDVANAGRTVLFVSHNMSAITQLCTRGILLDSGRIAYTGRPGECVAEYLHRNEDEAEVRIPEHGACVMGLVRVNGSAVGSVHAGSPFSLSVTVHARELRNPWMFVVIEDAAGRTVVHNRISSQDIGAAVLDGPCSITVKFPSLWMSPGVYSAYFKFLVAAPDGSSGRAFSPRLPLEITGELEQTGKAALNPAVSWTRTAADPQVAGEALLGATSGAGIHR